MPLSQTERRDIREAIKMLDEQDLLHTPVKEGGKGPYAMKAHPLAPEEVDGVRPAPLSHEAFNYLHEGPDDNCPVCRHITLNRLQRELLEGLLK